MVKLIISSMALGIGLAMDASAVSMANGLNDNKMKLRKVFLIAGMFGFFQALMPLIGYLLGHTVYEAFSFIEKYKIIPILALLILAFIGGKMLFEGIKDIKEAKKDNSDNENKEVNLKKLTFGLLIVQAIATSIDALSVGITISDYTIKEAIICALIVDLMTFIICVPSVYIGKKVGMKLGPWAEILGGSILIIIGLIIFFTGIF